MSVTADLVTMRQVDGDAHVYAMGEVPPKPPYPYVVIGFGINAPVVRTQDGAGDPIRRFYAQHFARTSGVLEDQADITVSVFDGASVSGDVCELEVATLPDRDADDRGVLSTTHTYRF